MKTCSNKKCKQINPQSLTEFNKFKHASDGFQSRCKSCAKISNAIYRSEHREKISAQHADYYQQNRDKMLEKQKEYYQQNKEEVLSYQADYRKDNRQEIAVKSALYREKNREEIAMQQSAYYEANKDGRIATYIENHKEEIVLYNINYYKENKEESSVRNAIWYKANPGTVNALAAKKRAIKLQATPKNLNKEQKLEIQAVYIEAARLTKETGIKHHVDHILPLQGEEISGLHVPWNIQILTASENIKKKNKFDFTYENEGWRK